MSSQSPDETDFENVGVHAPTTESPVLTTRFVPRPGEPEAPGASNVSHATIEDQWLALDGISVSHSQRDLVHHSFRRQSAVSPHYDEESRTSF